MTTAYVESSALTKLVLEEPESESLRRDLREHDYQVSSDLSTVEVTRAAARVRGIHGITRARATFLSINSLPIDRSVIDNAALLEPHVLRSLDAIHIATALALGRDEVVFFSYDASALQAARAAGLTVASPTP